MRVGDGAHDTPLCIGHLSVSASHIGVLALKHLGREQPLAPRTPPIANTTPSGEAVRPPKAV
jgi:hypothetical protein